MATLTFQASDVRRVVEHALNAPSHQTSRYSKITGPALYFVHDQGVYLMSNGEPRDIVKGETSFCAYAKGMNPETDSDFYDAARDAVGGDDFAETLPLEYVNQMNVWLSQGAQSIAIKLTKLSLKIEPRFGRGKTSHIAK